MLEMYPSTHTMFSMTLFFIKTFQCLWCSFALNLLINFKFFVIDIIEKKFSQLKKKRKKMHVYIKLCHQDLKLFAPKTEEELLIFS